MTSFKGEDNLRINKFFGTCLILLQFSVYFLFFWFWGRNGILPLRILWGVFQVITLMGMVIFVFSPSKKKDPLPEGRAIAIVPVYNEDPDVLKSAIDALVNQTVEIDEIHVIDDGSDVPMAAYEHPRVFCHWQQNTGKRGAQATVLRSLDPDTYSFIITVDSDSILDELAAEIMLRAMSDPEVKACSGAVYLSNYDKNLLTRIQEFEYGISFTIARSSRQVIGFTETTSGACAIYRSEIVNFHLDDYLTSGTVGDDKRLCIYSLLEGKVLFTPEAVVYTQAPETVKQLWRQRIRWSLSTWMSYPVVFTNFGLKECIFPIINLLGSVITPLALAFMVYAFFMNPLSQMAIYLVYWITVNYSSTTLYVLTRKQWNKRKKFLNWLFMSPLLIVSNLFMSIPSKYAALFKMKNITWGTRGTGSTAPKLEKDENEKKNETKAASV